MDQVGEHRLRRSRIEPRIDVGVDHRHHLGDTATPLGDLVEDLGLARQPVRLVGRQERRHVLHRRSVRGPQPREAPRRHLVQAGVVVPHVAVRRADHGGRPAHHMIAREQGVLLQQRPADVVGGMAGGGDGLQRPARSGKARPVGDHAVGCESVILALVQADGGLGCARRGKPPDHRARGLGQRPGQRGMVEMGVGEDDGGDPLALGGAQQGVEMLGQVGAGIDHRRLAAADDVGSGAGIGERARVGRHHAADQRRDLIGPPGLEGDVTDVGDHLRRRSCVGPGQELQNEGVMAKARAISVPNRPQWVIASMVCLFTLQAMVLLSSCHPEFLPSAAARVAVGR